MAEVSLKEPILLTAAFQAPLTCLDEGKTILHAVSMKELIHRWLDEVSTGVTPVCAELVQLLRKGVGLPETMNHAVTVQVMAFGPQVVPWPVQHRLPGGLVRCRTCWEGTGKKRPRSKLMSGPRPDAEASEGTSDG